VRYITRTPQYLIWFYYGVDSSSKIKRDIEEEFGGQAPEKIKKVPTKRSYSCRSFCQDSEDAFRCAYGI
jgi:hypothetical protein